MRVFILVFAVLFSLVGCSKDNGHDIESLLETSLKSFKSNNLNMYLEQVMITEAELIEIIDLTIKTANSEEIKKKLEREKAKSLENYQNKKRMVSRSWARVMKKAEEKGLNWESSSIVTFSFKPKLSSAEVGINRGSVVLLLQSSEDFFSYQIDDCIKLPSSTWKCLEPLGLRKQKRK